MKSIFLILLFVFTINAQPLKFKAKIGFDRVEDSIIRHEFIENGKKVYLLSQKDIQLWDVESGKLLNSVRHDIQRFKPRGSFFTNYILLGLPTLMNPYEFFRPYYIEPNGKTIITIEKPANQKFRSAVVRDMQTSKQIALLSLPDSISTDWVTFDATKNEIITVGQEDNNAAFANWDKDTFQPRQIINIKDYRWHQPINNQGKVLVGTGGSDFSWLGTEKNGNSLTLRDVKNGITEKEFTAQNLMPKSSFQQTAISPDEKFLVSRRDRRIFVWEIAGKGSPKFEVSTGNPKESIELVQLFGKSLMSVSVGENLLIYDLNGDGSPKAEFKPTNPKRGANFNAASENGKYFSIYNEGKLSVYETTDLSKPLYEFTVQNEKDSIGRGRFWDEENLFFFERYSGKKNEIVKTEFHNVETGKLEFSIPFSINKKFKLTRDKKFLYSETLGSTSVWNFAESKEFHIGLYTETPSDTDSIGNTTYGSEQNVEDTALSPDNRYILKYGLYLTTIYDIATGKEIQQIFDPERVKYDKNNKMKDSGLYQAGWTADGKYVFAYSDSGKTISFWEVGK